MEVPAHVAGFSVNPDLKPAVPLVGTRIVPKVARDTQRLEVSSPAVPRLVVEVRRGQSPLVTVESERRTSGVAETYIWHQWESV